MNDPSTELSPADRALLRALQRDATLSMKALAQKAGMSASSAWRRVRELEAAGVIRDRVTRLDPTKLGLAVCMLVDVNIRRQDPAARAEFERWVGATDAVQQCFAVTGAHDYTLIVRTRSVEAFERFLMNELLAHPSVDATSTHLVLRQHKSTTALPV